MIYGMTAFARHQTPTPEGNIVWELRSVNHRFLETYFRLPDGFRDVEFDLRDICKRTLRRGKLDCSLRIEQPDANQTLEIHRPTLLHLLAAIEQIRRDSPEAAHPSPLDLLRWPGVLGQDAGPDDDAVKAQAADAFRLALDTLIEHRSREGQALGAILHERLDEVARLATDARAKADRLTGEIRDRLKARLADLVDQVDAGRLEQEVALLAQRADIAEELDRLMLHVDEARAALSGPGPHGRRLDFLSQELNREANTLGSKSVLPHTAKTAVDIKVVVEQIREQVQNLE